MSHPLVFEIYAREGCPYLEKSLNHIHAMSCQNYTLIQHRGENKEETRKMFLARMKAENIKNPKQTFPQIWVNGKHVGGGDDFVKYKLPTFHQHRMAKSIETELDDIIDSEVESMSPDTMGLLFASLMMSKSKIK